MIPYQNSLSCTLKILNFTVHEFSKVKRISQWLEIKEMEVFFHKFGSVLAWLHSHCTELSGYFKICYLSISFGDYLLWKLIYQEKYFSLKYMVSWMLIIRISGSLPDFLFCFTWSEDASHAILWIWSWRIPFSNENTLKTIAGFPYSGLKLCGSFIICSFYYEFFCER